jgi:hypothetical protein
MTEMSATICDTNIPIFTMNNLLVPTPYSFEPSRHNSSFSSIYTTKHSVITECYMAYGLLNLDRPSYQMSPKYRMYLKCLDKI